MASMIDELVMVLEEENEAYQNMIPIAETKTKAIINNDLEALQEITVKEQEVADRLTVLERKRGEVIVNIGTVINRNPKTLKLGMLADMLQGQPEQQARIRRLNEKLSATIKALTKLNEKNQLLIKQSLEIIDFNMNLLKSITAAPGSDGYTRNASSTQIQYGRNGGFDSLG